MIVIWSIWIRKFWVKLLSLKEFFKVMNSLLLEVIRIPWKARQSNNFLLWYRKHGDTDKDKNGKLISISLLQFLVSDSLFFISNITWNFFPLLLWHFLSSDALFWLLLLSFLGNTGLAKYLLAQCAHKQCSILSSE